jgi:hypothetical protein
MNFFIPLLVSILIFVSSLFVKHLCLRAFLWGFIVAPLSTGLYSLYFIPYIGILFAPFLFLNQLFNEPAWWLLVKKMNLINGEALSLFHELLLLLINGVFWGIVFVGIACLSKMIK